MSKVVLLDLDGIVIRPRKKYFSEKYSEDYGVPMDAIIPFFKGDYKKAARGEEGIREVLPPFLKKWGWEKTLDEFLDYWFEGEKDLDAKVLEKIKHYRSKGFKVYLVSDNEKERAAYVMDKIGLKNEFDGAFFSFKLGHTKSEPEFFEEVIKHLKVKPSEIIYWDDDANNVEVAKSIGINASVYTTFEDLLL